MTVAELALSDLRPRSPKSAAAFKTISEVADQLDVAQHVLRFWESKFPQVRPLKRGGGRRYYRPEDVAVLRQIRALLYEEGYTIRGAQKFLRAKRPRAAEPGGSEPEAAGVEPAGVVAAAPALLDATAELALRMVAPAPAPSPAPAGRAPGRRRGLVALRAELVEIRDLLAGAVREG